MLATRMLLTAVTTHLLVPATTFHVGRTFTKSWIQEAEKKHGRVAMLGLPAILAISAANPGTDPVQWLNAQPATMQLVFYSTAGLLETLNLKRLDAGFVLKQGETPGKLWNVSFISSPLFEETEDFAGRAAMVATAGMMIDSLAQTHVLFP